MNLKTCTDENCFNNALITCDKAFYVKDTTNTLIQYKIIGRSGDSCNVNVKLLQVVKGSPELAAIEGKEMNCFTPFGALTVPESNIELCHGLLKEAIQDMIIKRMHAQIVENLGKINEEITNVL